MQRKKRNRMRREYLIALVLVLLVSVWVGTRLEVDGFRVAEPLALLALPLVALAAWWLIERGERRRAAISFSRAADIRAVGADAGLWSQLAPLPNSLRLVALLLLAIALSRPQTFSPIDSLETEGIDIVLVLDLSESMKEEDLNPDRLTAAKEVVNDFISRRKNDRIGLVVFGREAFTYAPLTLDYSVLQELVSEVQIGLVDGKGTAIGNALGVGLARLRSSDAKSKVMVLITDGDSNAGNLTPQESASIAKSMGVRIFTVLVGEREGSGGALRMLRGPRHPVNPELLEHIAHTTGGTPYLATDTRSLARNFHDILEDLDRTKRRDVGAVYGELFPAFAWPAFAFVLLEIVLRLTRLRRLP